MGQGSHGPTDPGESEGESESTNIGSKSVAAGKSNKMNKLLEQQFVRNAFNSVVPAKEKKLIKNKTPADEQHRRQQQQQGTAATRKKGKLAAKYAAIDSLEERAYQILLDLGMVDEHNNS